MTFPDLQEALEHTAGGEQITFNVGDASTAAHNNKLNPTLQLPTPGSPVPMSIWAQQREALGVNLRLWNIFLPSLPHPGAHNSLQQAQPTLEGTDDVQHISSSNKEMNHRTLQAICDSFLHLNRSPEKPQPSFSSPMCSVMHK